MFSCFLVDAKPQSAFSLPSQVKNIEGKQLEKVDNISALSKAISRPKSLSASVIYTPDYYSQNQKYKWNYTLVGLLGGDYYFDLKLSQSVGEIEYVNGERTIQHWLGFDKFTYENFGFSSEGMFALKEQFYDYGDGLVYYEIKEPKKKIAPIWMFMGDIISYSGRYTGYNTDHSNAYGGFEKGNITFQKFEVVTAYSTFNTSKLYSEIYWLDDDGLYGHEYMEIWLAKGIGIVKMHVVETVLYEGVEELMSDYVIAERSWQMGWNNTCYNGLKDSTETGIDCGGKCIPCTSCRNRMKDPNEEGIDCGGVCLACKQLKILLIPIEWKGSQSDFYSRTKRQLDVFVNNSPLKKCADVVDYVYLDVTKNLSSLDCSNAIYSLNQHAEKYTSKTQVYDYILGFADSDLCGKTAGQSDNLKTAWIEVIHNDDSITAHEIGHFYDLEDEYCSNPAGSKDARCNDGGMQWNDSSGKLQNPSDLNPLDKNIGCDPRTGYGCCGASAGLSECSSVNYGVCCMGNSIDGGRAIMTYAGALSPRKFENSSLAKLSQYSKLRCPSGKMQLQAGNDISNSSVIIEFFLDIYSNDTVKEKWTRLIEGIKKENKTEEGYYLIFIKDMYNNIIFKKNFSVYFSYDGPMLLAVNYSSLISNKEEQYFSFPYNERMRSVEIYNKNKLLYNKSINFCDNDAICDSGETYLSCWEDCVSFAPDGLCNNNQDNGCDTDCAPGIDSDCPYNISIPLYSGWNLISIPLNISNRSVSSVLKNINYTYLLGYENKWFVPTQLNANSGYWIKVNNDQGINITGFPLSGSFVFNYSKKIFGYSYVLSNIIDDVNSSIFHYNKGKWYSHNQYKNNNSLIAFEAGKGYFLKN